MWNRTFYSLCTIFQKKGKVPSTDFPLLWKFEVFSIFSGEGETLCTKTLVQKRRRLLWGWRPYYPHMSEWSAYSNFFHKSGKMYEAAAAAQKFCCVFQPSAVFPSFSITRSWSDIQSIALCIELNFPEIENSVRIFGWKIPSSAFQVF